MRSKGAWSTDTYRSTASLAATRGTATFEGEERVRQGKGLDPLVDPRGLEKYGPIRGSGNLFVPEGDEFVLPFGVAMPVETDIDTTGSMGGNVNVAFRIQPKVQNLLIQGAGAVLRRYHVQMATGVVQDVLDQFPYQRSQFEPDNEVERQMSLLVPEKGGYDAPEDYQLGLFAAAYLTDAAITKYGLKGYYFSVGDQIGRDVLDPTSRLLSKVFGPDGLEKALGAKLPQAKLSTRGIGKTLLRNWHGFFLQVGGNRYTTDWWSDILGRERVVKLPRTEDLAGVQAVIIGLTEGTLDLQSAHDFLVQAGEPKENAKRIVDACSRIPVGLQATFPNFAEIPMAGARFASREDIWPIGKNGAKKSEDAKLEGSKPERGDKKQSWRL